RREGEPAAGLQIKARGLRAPGRPLLVLPPLVRAGLEDVRLRLLQLALVLEVVIEESQFDVFAVKLAGLRAELQIAQPVARAAGPAAVTPWPHHQHVPRLRIVLLNR